MGIFSFNKFITEKLGVSESSLIFRDILFIRTKSFFKDFVKSDEKLFNEIDVIGYRTLNQSLNTSNKELYGKFPVITFELNLNFKKLNDKEWEKKYSGLKQKLATGGQASFFGNKNWSGYSKIVNPIKQITDHGIIVNLGVSIDINSKFDLKNDNDLSELDDDINSTIYHELNHCYENYIRTIKYKSVLRPEYRSFDTTLSFTGENIWKFPKFIWKFWNKFNYYLYISEYHETRANVQEIFYFIKEYPNRDLKEFKIYDIADKMEKFNYENFYNEFLEHISTYEPYKGSEKVVADRFKEMWIRTYEEECKKQNTKPVISFKTLRSMSCLEFLKYWQKRINKAGQTIKRKAHNIKANL
jgi:hypothetical protein